MELKQGSKPSLVSAELSKIATSLILGDMSLLMHPDITLSFWKAFQKSPKHLVGIGYKNLERRGEFLILIT